MSPLNGHDEEMSRVNLPDSNIERLLRGESVSASDDALRRLIASLSIPAEPPRDVEQMATALAATARAAAAPSRGRGFRRLGVLASAGALVVALGGVAMASDGAIPGDPLYGLDRALERLGLGAGGVDERIAEFDALMGSGQEEAGYSLLAEVIEGSEGEDFEKAQQHLELAATKSSPSAQSAQEKVADLLGFIEEFKGVDGVVDGEEFGQGVADIARGDTAESPGASGSAPGQLDDTAPGNSEDTPVPQEEQETEGTSGSPGNSANAPGQQDSETPGNSKDAPGQQNKGE